MVARVSPLLRVLARPAALLFGVLAAGLVWNHLPDLRPDRLRALVGEGAAGMGELLAVGTGTTAVGAPRQLVAFAGGALFGALPGAGLALAAQVASCAIDMGWARLMTRGRRNRVLPGRLARLTDFLRANPFIATLTLRLLPVGNNLLFSLAAGAMRLPAGRVLAASAIGYTPQTIVFALLGRGVAVGHGALLGIGVALFVAASVCGLLLLRRLEPASSNGARPGDASSPA